MARKGNVKLFTHDGYLKTHISRSEYNTLIREQRIDDIVFNGKFWGAVLLHPRDSKPKRQSSPVISWNQILRNAGCFDHDRGNPCVATRELKDKINAWPFEHDRNAPVISAGVAYGVVEIELQDSKILVCSWPPEFPQNKYPHRLS